MPSCNRCGGEIIWPQPYVQGQKPLNTDNSAHVCSAPAQPQATTPNIQTGQPAVPKLTPTDVMGELAVFYEAHKEVPDAKFDALARIYISRMMSQR